MNMTRYLRPTARIGAAVSKRISLLVSCLVVFATACSSAEPQADIDLGAGKRFVPQVVDSITNVGVSPSVAMDPDGNPVITYLGYQSVPGPGKIPETRPVSLPLVPAVMYASEKDGVWTVGTVQQLDDGITQDVNGNAVPLDNAAVAGAVDSSGALNVVWIEKNGLMYAKDEGGQFVPSTVVKGSDVRGPSIALGDGGVPWISYYRNGAVMVATAADGWVETPVAKVSDCGDNCSMVRTSIQVGESGAVVAFAGSRGPAVGSFDGTDWTVDNLKGDGGYGISLAIDKRGTQDISYLSAGGTVTVAQGDGGGWTYDQAGSIEVYASNLITTGVAVDGDGVRYLTWYDTGTKSVKVATDQSGSFQEVPVPGTDGGASPSIAASAGGAAVWLAWYDAVNENLQAGSYADQEAVLAATEPVAASTQAPMPSAPATSAPPASPTDDGAKPVTLSITAPAGAVGTGFTEKTLKAPAGTPIKLVFDNQDPGVPHNVEIWTADPLKDTAATSLFVGEQTTGPAKITYDVPPLEAGTYFYRCVVHPTTMTGTLTVG